MFSEDDLYCCSVSKNNVGSMERLCIVGIKNHAMVTSDSSLPSSSTGGPMKSNRGS